MENLGKMLVSIGALLTVVGLMLWLAADKLSWFGRMPGDIRPWRTALAERIV